MLAAISCCFVRNGWRGVPIKLSWAWEEGQLERRHLAKIKRLWRMRVGGDVVWLANAAHFARRGIIVWQMWRLPAAPGGGRRLVCAIGVAARRRLAHVIV